MNLEEKTIAEKEIFSGNIIKVNVDTVLLPNGNSATREVVHHNGGVCIVALDKDYNTYMVTQFRYPYKKELLEVPAGKIDLEEHHFSTATRELKEEIGAQSDDITYLGFLYPSPGYCDEIIHIYLAKNITLGKQMLDHDEFINITKLKFEQAYTMAINGQINDAKTVIALCRAKAHING